MEHPLRQSQLTLLGTLPAARIDITIHLDNGSPDREWWLRAMDDEENLVALWSDRTSPGPRGGLNVAELLTALLDVLRLVRGDPQASETI